MRHGNALRDAIGAAGTTPLIGVYDMYSASIAASHYDGMFVSGFGFAASHYGLPDIGFIAWPDMLAFVERLRGAFPAHHLLVDVDDGYGDPEVACHVVRRLERVGASGVILEDQKRPRRCGHVAGKQILPLDEYLDKLERVLACRTDLLVVARTDATDEDEILRRAKALAATDADVVLVDGVRDVAAIRRIRESIGDKPLLFNQIAEAAPRGFPCPSWAKSVSTWRSTARPACSPRTRRWTERWPASGPRTGDCLPPRTSTASVSFSPSSC